MVIKKAKTTVEQFVGGKIWDYPMPDEPVGISYQEHHGRVPKKGWGVNTVCWEAYYIIEGSAKVWIDDDEYTVASGDVVILKPNQRSFLVTKKLRLLTITQPNWYPEQYKETNS